MASVAPTLTFAEHIHELRKRLMWSLLFVAIGAGIGYALHGSIIEILQKPLNESLYYTTPTGAFSFIIKVCCVFGLVVALPIVVYQIFGFFGPLLPKKSRRSIVWYVFWSVMLAAGGIAFAYFISLPASLHFLVNFGSEGGDIQALITADEYFNFVLAYIAGFAVLFQLPLIISFINRMTPLKPSQLIGGLRYVVLGSFVASAIITPTPDPLNQALMAGPIIALYLLSVILIALMNIRKQPQPTKSIFSEQPARHTPPAAGLPLHQVLPKQPAYSPALPSSRQPQPAPRRLVSDMVLPRSARAPRPLVAQRKQTTKPTRTHIPKTVQRQQVSIGLISDFIPASN